MKLEWIDDLLAVIDAGSLSSAAQQRHITQPAFSRRISGIEKQLNANLIDRNRKPIQAQPALIAMEGRLRETSQLLHELKCDISNTNNEHGELIVAGQHAISTTLAPTLVKTVGDQGDIRIRLRSANREDCMSLLLMRQVDIALLYQLNQETHAPHDSYIEAQQIGEERLTPVTAKNQYKRIKQEIETGFIRLIAYPRDVFLGDVLFKQLLPQLSDSMDIRYVTETALTSAAMQLAIAGNGIAWLPLSLAHSAIQRGELVQLDSILPSEAMSIMALKLAKQDKALVVTAWKNIVSEDWQL